MQQRTEKNGAEGTRDQDRRESRRRVCLWGTVGLLGLDGGLDMDVLDVETLALVLEES